jgi:succinoglycan biosynthesis transport protein ExoP
VRHHPVQRPANDAGVLAPFEPLLQEEAEVRLNVASLLWRHRWLILGCVLVALGAAFLYVRLTTPLYEATASIRIEPSQPQLAQRWAVSQGTTVSTDIEVLGSRSLTEDATRALNLQVQLVRPRRVSRDDVLEVLEVTSRAEPGAYRLARQPDGHFAVEDGDTREVLTRTGPGERFSLRGASLRLKPRAASYQEIQLEVLSFADAVAAVGRDIAVSRAGREADVLRVHYQSSDRELVWRVPNLIVESFIAHRRETDKIAATSQVKFLRGQLDTLSGELTKAEEGLRQYRERAQVVNPSVEATSQISRLITIETERSTLEAERSALAKLVAEVDRQNGRQPRDSASPYRLLLAFPTLMRNQAASQLLQSLVTVEDQRVSLLIRRTENDADVQALTARIHELEHQISSLARTYLQGLTNQMSSVDSSIAHFSRDLQTIPRKELEFTRLERRPAVLKDMYTLLQTRLKEAEIAQAAEDASVSIVDPAIEPRKPIHPRAGLTLVAALAGGLLLGVGCAFAVEYHDRSIRSRADVFTASGLPVLGLIPRIHRGASPVALIAEPGKRRIRSTTPAPSPPPHLPSRYNYTFLQAGATGGPDEPGQPPVARSRAAPLERTPLSISTQAAVIAEAYGILQTNIAFARADTPAKTLVFTSPLSGDGKTTTVVNLAVSLAQRGVRVLLIDADVRRGVLHSVFRGAREPGLLEVLRAHVTFESARRGVVVGERGTMDYLTTGKLHPDDAGLMASDSMRHLLARAREEYDLVILDTPPVNIITDAAILAANADAVVLVARAGVTDAAALTYAVQQLNHVRAAVVGVVLNDIDFRHDAGYDTAYRYFTDYEYSTDDA